MRVESVKVCIGGEWFDAAELNLSEETLMKVRGWGVDLAQDQRAIPGYGMKYVVDRGGGIVRQTRAGNFVPVALSGWPARVRLYRLGKVYRPWMHKLMASLFDDMTPEEALAILKARMECERTTA